jgi:UDP-N-acetyl-D-mannosaminuronic acid transferase (WecB/TagA/CpsF family)
VITVNKKKKILNFYGINFYNLSFNTLLSKLNKGGYLVAPAASALVNIKKNSLYYESLKKSQVAIFDSGFFCLILKLKKIFSPKKLSGYLFLSKFLSLRKIKNKKILLINASDIQCKKNLFLFKRKNFTRVFFYNAPFYKNKIKDNKIIGIITRLRPYYIIINIGGEKQEPLAYFIKKKVKTKVRILCFGAAIDFITKLQAPINIFWDRYYLGWFIRLLNNPFRFFFRTILSLKLLFFFK